MEATEKALRQMGQRLGGTLLEKLLNGKGGLGAVRSIAARAIKQKG